MTDNLSNNNKADLQVRSLSILPNVVAPNSNILANLMRIHNNNNPGTSLNMADMVDRL